MQTHPKTDVCGAGSGGAVLSHRDPTIRPPTHPAATEGEMLTYFVALANASQADLMEMLLL